MKKILFGSILWILAMVVPMSAMADVDVHVSIPLPPPVVFSVPPPAVVIPGTYVYGLPDVQENIFFYNGWWWRPWEGRWYRSRNYRSGWVHYPRVPSFYGSVPPDWRHDYHARHWKGHPWDYQPIPHDRIQNNWKRWEKNKHWERQNNWGVRDMKFQPPSPRVHEERFSPRHSREEIRANHASSRQVESSREGKAKSHEMRVKGNKHSQGDKHEGRHDRGERQRSERR
ncbi:MAG: hypothetical protein A4E72_02195 [Syntrophus sp. PtaU1.Bin208]|nr:MAG: hypothetical protein A4E72_02195 [Syntrophus sp. PtaU1.Bin208]